MIAAALRISPTRMPAGMEKSSLRQHGRPSAAEALSTATTRAAPMSRRNHEGHAAWRLRHDL